MDQQQIKTLIDAMAASDLAEMEFAQDGWTLRLVRRAPYAAEPASKDMPRLAAGEGPAAVATLSATPPLMAPLYGVVHLSPGPGEPPFAVPGERVGAGQTLCVIEAMKVFNEVRAERDSTLAEVLVESGQEVDAEQPLMRFA